MANQAGKKPSSLESEADLFPSLQALPTCSDLTLLPTPSQLPYQNRRWSTSWEQLSPTGSLSRCAHRAPHTLRAKTDAASSDRLARLPRHQPPHVLPHHGPPSIPRPATRSRPPGITAQRTLGTPLRPFGRPPPFHSSSPFRPPRRLHPFLLPRLHFHLRPSPHPLRPSSSRGGPHHFSYDRGGPPSSDARQHCPPQDGRDAHGEAACDGLARAWTEEQDEREDGQASKSD